MGTRLPVSDTVAASSSRLHGCSRYYLVQAFREICDLPGIKLTTIAPREAVTRDTPCSSRHHSSETTLTSISDDCYRPDPMFFNSALGDPSARIIIGTLTSTSEARSTDWTQTQAGPRQRCRCGDSDTEAATCDSGTLESMLSYSDRGFGDKAHRLRLYTRNSIRPELSRQTDSGFGVPAATQHQPLLHKLYDYGQGRC